MIGRPRRHTTIGDDVEPFGLHVFIPGALAGGFLISIGLLIGDAVRKVRGDGAIDRRVIHTGAAVADEVRAGAGASRRTASGLRPRWIYGLVAALSFGLVLLVIPGATWNFLNPGGYISDISWIWAISMVASIGFGVIGVQSIRLAPEWLPPIIGALGVGVALRFALGSESEVIATTLVVSGLLGGALGMAVTRRLRQRSGVVSVPPSTRPILVRTPLTRSR